MRKFCLIVGLFLGVYNSFGQPDTSQKIIPGRNNSPAQQQKPYVILISADGFRHDYAEKHGAKMLLALAGQGVKAEAMIPSYPTLTFPNHYSIVTGLYPSHHGLASNYFYSTRRNQFYSMKTPGTFTDGTWYGGTPLWVLAEQQQMLSASFYWVGSEADIKGVHPTYYYKYNEAISIDSRIQTVLNWLQLPEVQRPHLITFYMPQTDHAGHDYGPDAPETKAAVQWVDLAIQKLTDAVKTTGLPVNFIVVGDHGMTKIDQVNTIPMPSVVDSSKFFIPRGFELIELYAKKKRYIKPTYRKLKKSGNGYTAYLKSGMPEHLHYGKKDDRMNVIGDILLIPEWPQIFYYANSKPDPGAHGFDPTVTRDMYTIFYAWGPNFRNNMQVAAFENVNVYPVIAKILGLEVTEIIDGSNGLADQIVK
jgi:predicted AlkP superfamily pyrophosphatase or phosphodiesterase